MKHMKTLFSPDEIDNLMENLLNSWGNTVTELETINSELTQIGDKDLSERINLLLNAHVKQGESTAQKIIIVQLMQFFLMDGHETLVEKLYEKLNLN